MGDEQQREREARLDRIVALQRRLSRELPEIDPAELLRIVENLLTPFGCGRRYFLRSHRDGYVI